MRRDAEPLLVSQRIAAAIAVFVVAGSLITFAGWAADSALVTSLLPGRVAMNPLTALTIFLAGLSLALTVSRRARLAARLSAVVVAGVGLACVACYFAGVDLRIDRILFSSQLGDNRVAPNTGLCLLLAGLSLTALQHERGLRMAEALASLLAAWSFVSVMGYVFGSQSFYGFGAYIPMALNTALLLHLLGLAIVLATAGSSLAAVVDANSAGAVVARRLIPAAVGAPLVFGWLELKGALAGLYDSAFGAALVVVATIVVLLVVIVWAVRSVDRATAQRSIAQATLHTQETQYRALVDGVQEYAIFLLDPRGNVSTWNDGAQRITGYQAADVLGRPFSRFYPPEDLIGGKPLQELAHAAKHGCVRDEGWRVRRDGSQFWAYTVITAIRNGDGAITGFSKITRDMTAQREYQERLATLNDELEARVEQRTRELAEANRDLEAKNRENETFVYSVSHDLRSPLVNLQGFSAELDLTCQELGSALSADEVPAAVRERAAQFIDPGMKEPIHFIRTAVTRLSAIIDALLRLSRAGRVEYQIRDVDLDEVARRIIDSTRATMAQRNAEIILQPLPRVRGDATALEQVFANLIGNALNYLHPDRPGTITIGVAADDAAGENGNGRFCTCFVRDNGLGIAAASQAKAFQAFQRLHPAAAPGEGMGLTIVRRVVERHGGRVWVKSTENEGSTFYVSLPVSDANRADSPQVGADNSENDLSACKPAAPRKEEICHAH